MRAEEVVLALPLEAGAGLEPAIGEEFVVAAHGAGEPAGQFLRGIAGVGHRDLALDGHGGEELERVDGDPVRGHGFRRAAYAGVFRVRRIAGEVAAHELGQRLAYGVALGLGHGAEDHVVGQRGVVSAEAVLVDALVVVRRARRTGEIGIVQHVRCPGGEGGGEVGLTFGDAGLSFEHEAFESLEGHRTSEHVEPRAVVRRDERVESGGVARHELVVDGRLVVEAGVGARGAIGHELEGIRFGIPRDRAAVAQQVRVELDLLERLDARGGVGEAVPDVGQVLGVEVDARMDPRGWGGGHAAQPGVFVGERALPEHLGAEEGAGLGLGEQVCDRGAEYGGCGQAIAQAGSRGGDFRGVGQRLRA